MRAEMETMEEKQTCYQDPGRKPETMTKTLITRFRDRDQDISLQVSSELEFETLDLEIISLRKSVISVEVFEDTEGRVPSRAEGGQVFPLESKNAAHC